MQYQVIVTKTLTNEAKDFIKNNHYLKSCSRGNKFVFNLYDGINLVGVAAFAYPTSKKVVDKYGQNILELKRFALVNTVPNTGSWFISKCIKLLKLKGIKQIISYADPEQGHEGILYKASNFKYLGKQKFKGVKFQYNGKWFHQRAVYQNSKIGKLIRQQYKLGNVTKKYLKPKHIYFYNIKRGN